MARRGAAGHIEGMKAAREALQDLNAHVQRLVGKEAVNAAADIFVDAVQAAAPVSSRGNNQSPGSLRRSIRKKSSRSTKNLARVEVRADDVAAVPNEFGTSKMEAQPFFRPAVDANRARAAQKVADTVRDEVEHGPWAKGRE